ncbi:response regulator transcription factor [Streptomyces ramulosus]
MAENAGTGNRDERADGRAPRSVPPGGAPAPAAEAATDPAGGTGTIRVLLVDDHQVVRRGLRTFLEIQDDIEVVGEAADGTEGIAAAERLRPDVVLMDVKMPGTDGIEALRTLRELANPARVLIVTSFTEQRTVVPALRAGAAGYVYKDIDPEALAGAIRSVHAGHVLLQPEVAGALLTQDEGGGGQGRGTTLTERESEVLGLIADGRSNREIARALVLSEKTVKTHVSNILMKLDLADRTQAALWAVRHGIGA